MVSPIFYNPTNARQSVQTALMAKLQQILARIAQPVAKLVLEQPSISVIAVTKVIQ